MSTIQPYSRQYHPPVPVLDIFLSFPDSSDGRGPFLAELDSGADLTIIPLSIITALGVIAIDQITLMSQWRDRHLVHLFQADVRIAGIVLPAIDVAGDPRSKEILLDRNVLNRLDLRLEGPRLRTHVFGG